MSNPEFFKQGDGENVLLTFSPSLFCVFESDIGWTCRHACRYAATL